VTPSTAPAKPGDPPVMGILNPSLKGKPLVRYDFQYAVAGNQLTLIENPDGTHRGSVEFDTTAYSADGTKLNVWRETLNFTVAAGQVSRFAQKWFEARVHLDLPPGKVFIRAGVLDVPSQKMGTLEIPQTVAKK
jgi:hypothetical protein